ncbi:YegP family protein [Arthrobacter sp. ISL-48]|nr:YegP family protein [Arthrobacter sp. ISL-48]
MTGTFELFFDGTTGFGFRLKAADGTVMAVSPPFVDKRAAVIGITAVRECAGMGLISDLCPEIPLDAVSAGAAALKVA